VDETSNIISLNLEIDKAKLKAQFLLLLIKTITVKFLIIQFAVIATTKSRHPNDVHAI